MIITTSVICDRLKFIIFPDDIHNRVSVPEGADMPLCLVVSLKTLPKFSFVIVSKLFESRCKSLPFELLYSGKNYADTRL